MNLRKLFYIIFGAMLLLSLIFFIFFQQFFILPFMFCLPFSCGSGRRIERRVNQNNETQAQDRETQTQRSVESREYDYICPRCGSVIEKRNLRFCPNCGNKL